MKCLQPLIKLCEQPTTMCDCTRSCFVNNNPNKWINIIYRWAFSPNTLVYLCWMEKWYGRPNNSRNNINIWNWKWVSGVEKVSIHLFGSSEILAKWKLKSINKWTFLNVQSTQIPRDSQINIIWNCWCSLDILRSL